MQRHYLIYLANLLALKRRLTELFCFDALTQVKSQATFQSVCERGRKRDTLSKIGRFIRLDSQLSYLAKLLNQLK